MSRAVTLDGISLWGHDTGLDVLFERAEAAAGDIGASLELARELGRSGLRPGAGATAGYFEVLATLAAADVTVARVVEPHLDALAILAECPVPVQLARVDATGESTWGVFAAEGPGVRLAATQARDGWRLDGTKPWCSLAGALSHALVTAHLGSSRRLFAVALQGDGVTAHPEAWVARGFPAVPSGPTDFAEVPAVPVGEPGWYLERPGFEWGGIGVAAAWLGGAVGVARRVHEAAAQRGGELAELHAGRVATSLAAARAALAAAARTIDATVPMATGGVDAALRASTDGVDEALPRSIGGVDATRPAHVPVGAGAPARERGAGDDDSADADERAVLAQVTRSVVRRACDDVLQVAAHALGPAPQALDPAYAARVADLSLYLLQDHGDRDEARTGRLLLGELR